MSFDWATALIKAVSGLCEEVRMLRDDLYNHAAIVNGPAFSVGGGSVGSVDIATSQMPPGATFARAALQNNQPVPIAVIVRLEPVVTQGPPSAMIMEDGVLLIGVSGTSDTTPELAALAPTGKGQSQTVVLRPSETLWVGAMASQAVTVSWRAVALRGRKILFTT